MTAADKLPEKLLRYMLEREASISIGASTARGMGKGTVKVAQDFLKKLDLCRFVQESASETAFGRYLDGTTKRFSKELPSESWGAARKFLNIFLRGALYNRFLCDHYALIALEPFLEVPLDRSVATGLREEEGGGSLPRWRTIVGLSKDDSDEYQKFASKVSQQKGYARVHLDVCYFRRNTSEG
jgi:hypothetical protein